MLPILGQLIYTVSRSSCLPQRQNGSPAASPDRACTDEQKDAMRTYVLLNPAAGHSDPQEIREQIAEQMPSTAWDVTIRHTTAEDDVTQLAREAVEAGAELICAAGGDGTVSHVVDALVGTDALLGIIPAGTTNALAQALGIPRDMKGAINVIANPERRVKMDAMEVDGSYYVLGVGVGLSAVTMEETSREDKQRFGELAYVWTVMKQLTGWQPRHYTVEVDGERHTLSAGDILLANAGVLTGRLKWGEHIKLDDGQADLCVIRARNVVDYLDLLIDVVRGQQRRNRHIQFFTVKERVKVSAGRQLAVTGDGEIIGHTPFEARIVPAAVTVLAPGAEEAVS